MSPTLDQSHACLLCGRYSLEYLLMNCMTIWKVKDCNLRKQKGTEKIDKMILRNCKRQTTGLEMAWIDYKKASEMVPHNWLKKCMMFGVAENMQKVLSNSMKKSKTELTA